MSRIGAVVQGAGSRMRVFAPNATAVQVCGDWNGWDEATAVPLARSGDFWEGPVAGLVAVHVLGLE